MPETGCVAQLSWLVPLFFWWEYDLPPTSWDQNANRDTEWDPAKSRVMEEEEVTLGDYLLFTLSHLLPCFPFPQSSPWETSVNVNSSPCVPGFENVVQICASGIKCAPRTQSLASVYNLTTKHLELCELTGVSLPCNTPSLAHKTLQNKATLEGTILLHLHEPISAVHCRAHSGHSRSWVKGMAGVWPTLCPVISCLWLWNS